MNHILKNLEALSKALEKCLGDSDSLQTSIESLDNIYIDAPELAETPILKPKIEKEGQHAYKSIDQIFALLEIKITGILRRACFSQLKWNEDSFVSFFSREKEELYGLYEDLQAINSALNECILITKKACS